METPASPSHVVVAFDATKDYNECELRLTINSIRVRGDIVRDGDTLRMLGVLHRVTHPMGYQSKPWPKSFMTSTRAVEEEISRKVDAYINMLHQSAEDCEEQGVSIEVKITAGIPVKNVILQEIETSKAAWVIIDRHLRRKIKLHVYKQMPCKVALVQDGFALEVLRNHTIGKTDPIQHKLLYSMSKPVSVSNFHGITSKHPIRQDFGFFKAGKISDAYVKGEHKLLTALNLVQSNKEVPRGINPQENEATSLPSLGA